MLHSVNKLDAKEQFVCAESVFIVEVLVLNPISETSDPFQIAIKREVLIKRIFSFPEKAVVYNFMDHVAKATTKEVPSTARPTTPQPKKPIFTNEYFYKQRAKSARSQRITERIDLPPRPKTVHSFRNDANEVTEGLKLEKDEPNEHAHDHTNHVHHTEGKCEFCDYQRVQRLLEYLNR